MEVSLRDALRIAALVLLVVAAIGALGSDSFGVQTCAGVAYAGLACLVASLLGTRV